MDYGEALDLQRSLVDAKTSGIIARDLILFLEHPPVFTLGRRGGRENLLVDEHGQIFLFDFDDCAYSWYMNDIAIVLFYAVMWEEDAAGFTQAFMTHFLRGYSRENHLDPAWLVQIPHFLKLREIDLYAVIHRSFDVESLDDPWCAGCMRRRKERIKNGTPYVEYGFEKLSSIM